MFSCVQVNIVTDTIRSVHPGWNVERITRCGVRRRKQNYSLENKSKRANYRKKGKGGPVNNMQCIDRYSFLEVVIDQYFHEKCL